MPINVTEAYDDGNIFARILRGEIPSTAVYEDEHTLACLGLCRLADEPATGHSQQGRRDLDSAVQEVDL